MEEVLEGVDEAYGTLLRCFNDIIKPYMSFIGNLNMPIEIDGKEFTSFDSAVEHVKKTKKNIKDPEKYVATIERTKRKTKQLSAARKIFVSDDEYEKAKRRLRNLVRVDRDNPSLRRPMQKPEAFELEERYIQSGVKIDPSRRPTGKKIDRRLRKRLASLADEAAKRRIRETNLTGVPYGKENRKTEEIEHDEALRTYIEGAARMNDLKVRPPEGFYVDRHSKNGTVMSTIRSSKPRKPKRKDFIRIIKAKIQNAKEQLIAKEHEHQVVFKKAGKKGIYKSASLVSNDGIFAKYWLLNAKQVNGNGWGVDPQTIKQNIIKFRGRPFVITAKEWIPNSEYGETYEHPYLPTNDINEILTHQAKFRVGNIVDVFEDKNGDWYASIQIQSKYANYRLPPFCSPAIFQLDPSEPEGSISKWEALHLAGLMEDPAYGARIALLKGTCIGNSNSCSVQFKGAKLEPEKEENDDDLELYRERQEKRFKQNIDSHILRGKLEKILGQKNAILGKPYKKPIYGKDDLDENGQPDILNRVNDDVMEYGHNIGHKLLENSKISEQSIPKIMETMDNMLNNTDLEINNSFGPNFEGARNHPERKYYDNINKAKERTLNSALHFHDEDFAMNQEETRPKNSGEVLGRKLFEPVIRMKEEEIMKNPNRSTDYFEGKKILNNFNDAIYNKLQERINFHTQDKIRPPKGNINLKLRKKLAKLKLAEREAPRIKPVRYYGDRSENTVIIKPKLFLDKTGSTGLLETIAGKGNYIQHNSGTISDLGGVHSELPDSPLSRSVDPTNIDIFDDEGKDTRNKILGTGKDERPDYRKYSPSRYNEDRPFKQEIFRGDELGTIEYLKRRIRSGQPIERPLLDLNKNVVTSHEGRHRSRALMEEGENVEVDLNTSDEFFRKHPDLIYGQRGSLDELMKYNSTQPLMVDVYNRSKKKHEKIPVSPETLKERLTKIKDDTRYPILGRTSKLKSKLRLAGTLNPNKDDPDYAEKITDWETQRKMSDIEDPFLRKKTYREDKYTTTKIPYKDITLEGYHDNLPGIPPSRVIGTSPKDTSELDFKIREYSSMDDYKPTNMTEEQFHEFYKRIGHGPFDKKHLHPNPDNIDVDYEPAFDNGVEQPTPAHYNSYDTTMGAIYGLLEQDKRDEARTLLMQYMPLGDNNPDDILDFILENGIDSLSSENIYAISRKNAERYSKLKARLAIMDVTPSQNTIKRQLRIGKLQYKYAGMRDVIKAFMEKRPLVSGNHKTDGKAYFLFGHEIARHKGSGLSVTNAGYPTPTTYHTLANMGVDFRVIKGVTYVEGKPYNDGDHVLIPYKSLKPREPKPKKTNSDGKDDSMNFKMRRFIRDVRKEQGNVSQLSITPDEQRMINKITGVNTPIPKPVPGTEGHHIFTRELFPELGFNKNNIITVSRSEHRKIHDLNPHITDKSLRHKRKKLKSKIAALIKEHPIVSNLRKIKRVGTYGSLFIADDGAILGDGLSTHYGMIFSPRINPGAKYDKAMFRLENLINDPDYAEKITNASYENFKKIMQDTRLIRVYVDSEELNLDVYTSPTTSQIKTMKDLTIPAYNRSDYYVNITSNVPELPETRLYRMLGVAQYGKQIKTKFANDFIPEDELTPEQRARALHLVDVVQKNRKLQEFINSPEGREANRLYVNKGIKINPKKWLEKTRRQEAKIICPKKLKEKISKIKLARSRYIIQQPQHVKINPQHGQIIANAYDALKHEPNNPEVKSAYDAFIRETEQQFEGLTKGGLKIKRIGDNVKPYSSSSELHADLAEKNELRYFPTVSGFGQGSPKDHPMLRPTRFKDPVTNQTLLANDVFRIVHDVRGHHIGGLSGFGPTGEQRAFLTHSKDYSPLARKALFTETAAQANWVVFSKQFGRLNRLNPEKMRFPQQKAGILPRDILEGVFHT